MDKLKEELDQYLDEKIQDCIDLRDMQKEKWAFIQVKKFIELQQQQSCEHDYQKMYLQEGLYNGEKCIKCYKWKE